MALTSLVLMSPLSGTHFQPADTVVLFAALAMGTLVSCLLISLALRPVKTLEQISHKVALGRISERVPDSLVADPDLAHLAATMNNMLDTLVADKKRMARLAAEVVYAQEKERAQLARDLHDSLGQSLAAASFQVAAAANQEGTAERGLQLASARDLLRTCLDEVRNISRSLHPRVTDDLGLPTALQALADRARQRSLIDANVVVELNGSAIPPALASTFYRIAEEALRNVEKRADAGTAVISLRAKDGILQLEVSDDGCGLDAAGEKEKADPVLANMRRRLSLAGGELHIHTSPDGDTCVTARANLESDSKAEDEAA